MFTRKRFSYSDFCYRAVHMQLFNPFSLALSTSIYIYIYEEVHADL